MGFWASRVRNSSVMRFMNPCSLRNSEPVIITLVMLLWISYKDISAIWRKFNELFVRRAGDRPFALTSRSLCDAVVGGFGGRGDKNRASARGGLCARNAALYFTARGPI